MSNRFCFEISLIDRSGNSFRIDGEYDERCEKEILHALKCAAGLGFDVRIECSEYGIPDDED